jgi:hypothetical protein
VEETKPHVYLSVPRDRAISHTHIHASQYPSRSRMVPNLRSNYRRLREDSPRNLNEIRDMSPIRSQFDDYRTIVEGDLRLIVYYF